MKPQCFAQAGDKRNDSANRPASCLNSLLACRAVAVAGLTACAAPAVLAAQTDVPVGTVIDARALTFARGAWGIAVNGQTYQQEAILSHLGWQYAVYYGEGGVLSVARRMLPDQPWESLHLADSVLRTRDNTHNVAVMGICANDGTIHLAYDHHASALNYRRSAPGLVSNPQTMPWNASQFSAATDRLEADRRRIGNVTYPMFFSAPDGRLQFLYRAGSSGSGDWHLMEYSGKDGGTWERIGMVLSRQGAFEGSNSRCAYPDRPQYGPDGRLHVTWCWREEPALMSNHDLCYAYSEDFGRTWKNNAGEAIAQLTGDAGTASAITVDSPGIVVHPIRHRWGLMNQTGQFVDAKGRVHVVRWKNPADAEGPSSDLNVWRHVHFWRDTDGGWRRNPLPFFGRKPQIVVGRNGDARVVYCKAENLVYHNRVAPGRLVVAGATEASGWTDWRTIWESEVSFVGEPLVDSARWNQEEVLTVYLQEEPTPAGTPSPLRAIDIRP